MGTVSAQRVVAFFGPQGGHRTSARPPLHMRDTVASRSPIYLHFLTYSRMSKNINLTAADRQYLAVLEELDGQASTREIRKRVEEWDDRAVRYRHNRHQRFGTVRVQKDSERTPTDVSAMKVAHLTETGEKLIAEGATAEAEVEQTTEEQLEDLTERFNEFEETMQGAFPWFSDVAARVRRLEDAFENISGENIDEYGDVEEYQ